MIHLADIYGGDGVWPLEVREDQKGFVGTMEVILARAYLFRRQRTRAFWVCDGETVVGIGLYHDSLDDDSYDLSQLLIDQRYQRKGCGKAAVALVLDEMRRDGKYDKVRLCYVEGNDATRRLAEPFGFREVSHEWDEIVMEADL